MRITPLKYASSMLSEAAILRGGDPGRVLPIDFIIYLIEVGERKLLVDTGCVTMPGFEMRDFCGPINALQAYGVEPTDITDLLITHAHHDHIECANAYPNTTIFIQCDEYEKAKKQNYISERANVQLFSERIEICRGVEMRRIGGHSIGSSVVHIRDGAYEYVIVGDECYKKVCMERGIPTGCSRCPEKSEAFIQTYSNPKYTLLYCHDT